MAFCSKSLLRICALQLEISSIQRINVKTARHKSVAHQDIVARRHFQLTCTNYAFSLASVALLLRAHLPTLAHDETKMRPWMHQTKDIKHNRYLSHGRARPNAGAIYAHTWFSGAPDVRRLPQPTGSAAEGSRVRQT